ncbi:MAG: NCS2 family permease [archaeon]|nr:NCS2 family permease [archaeon]
MSRFAEAVDRYFGITEKGSDIPTEIKGGIITFLSMVYILTVNPAIISSGVPGLSWNALFTSTALAAVISCLLMGLYARFPVALAPGMGVNAFLSYTMCANMGLTYGQALLGVLFSGILFFILCVTGTRTKLIESFSPTIRYSFTAGIGFFIAIVGLFNAGIIVHGNGSALMLGNLSEPTILLALLAIFLTLALWYRNVWGSALAGILVTSAIGIVFGIIPLPDQIFANPDFSLIGEPFRAVDGIGFNLVPFIAAVIALTVMDMFDTTGTILAITDRVSVKAKMELKLSNKALSTDAISTMAGAALGTTTTTSFIESCTGIESGARTGLMPIVVAVLFAASLIFSPVFSIFTNACIVGAVVLVGVLMMTSVKLIDWYDNVDAATAFMTIAFIGLSGSISDGMAFGTITYLLGKIVMKRTEEIPLVMWGLGIVFVLYLVLYYGYILNL